MAPSPRGLRDPPISPPDHGSWGAWAGGGVPLTSPEDAATPGSADGGRGERPKLICTVPCVHMHGAASSSSRPWGMDLADCSIEKTSAEKEAPRTRKRDRSGRQQDRSGRIQDRSGREQDRSGRQQDRSSRKKPSGCANRAAAKRKREEVAALESTAARVTAASTSAALTRVAVGSTAEGSMGVGSTTVRSTAEGSMGVGSTSVGSLAVGSMAEGTIAVDSTMAVGSTAAASAAGLADFESSVWVARTTAAANSLAAMSSSPNPKPNPISSAASEHEDEDDPGAGWGSDGYCSSGLDLPMGETYIPLGEDEAELREHDKRAESRAAHELHIKHQQILDQIPRPQHKRGPRGHQTSSFYPNHSTWTPGLIPDLLSPHAERLASIAADIQRLEEREFSLRGQILAANAIEAALNM